MPCRAARLCRLQEQQSLWITDDVLADAWHRFARLSLTNGSNTKNHGRRHGSSVPGPLEAHRRLAKRRMALATNTVGGVSPSFDLGVLLGLAPYGSNRRMDDWKYEPPGIKNVHKTNTVWDFGLNLIGNKSWEKVFRMSDPLSTPEVPKDPVAESKAAFESLLSTQHLSGDVQSLHLRAALEFLQSAADEPGARNAERLAHWLLSNTSSPAALQRYLDLVLEKIRLRTLASPEISSIVSCCLRHPDAGPALATISNIILASEDTSAICVSTTQILLDTVVDRGHLVLKPNPLLDLWLRCLRQYHVIEGPTTSRAYHDIFTMLAERTQGPSVLADDLSKLPDAVLADVLLRHWVPRFMAKSCRQDLADGDSKLLSSEPAERILPSPEALDHVQSRYKRFLKEPQHGRKPLCCLVIALNCEKHTRSILSHNILEILLQRQQAKDVYFHFMQFSTFKIGVSIDLANRLIRLLLDANDLGSAWNVFKTHQEVSLSRFHDLPLGLVHSGRCTSAHIWQILQRQTAEDKIPRAKRVLDKLSLLPGHIDLIHQIAFAYAESPHLTARMAFRRVWECYVFLKDRGAPIKPLLARAMVAAGVTRYLKEGQRVSSAGFVYILSVVSRLEGAKVAGALDRIVWRIWKEVVEPKARAAKASGDPEASEATRTLAFRPTRSSTRKRAWLQWDEQHYREVRKGKALYAGARFEQPHGKDIVDAASVSYDTLMEMARAPQETHPAETYTSNQIREHIQTVETSDNHEKAHFQQEEARESHLHYTPMR